MQTIKTAVVVVLMLVVLYGAYEILNRPEQTPPPEIADLEFDVDVPNISYGGSGTAPGDTPNFGAPPSGPAVPIPAPNHGTTMVPPGAGNPPADSGAPQWQPPTPGPTADLSQPNPPATAPTQPPVADQTPPPSVTKEVDGVQENPYVGLPIVTPGSEASSPPATPSAGAQGYARTSRMAQQDIADGQYQAALAKLSVYYRSPDLTEPQHKELLDLLDPLAGKVIYSQEHLVDAAYRVRGSETLNDLAAQYGVPAGLLQRVNSIENPLVLVPGTELKVLRGPFRAEVSPSRQELTLFLGDMYAGRFPISVGNSPRPPAGKYQVRGKESNRAYYGATGMISGGSPQNPYGHVWLDLGGQVCIHGSSPQPGLEQQGCIGLSPRDAADVFSILSVGSTVTVLP